MDGGEAGGGGESDQKRKAISRRPRGEIQRAGGEIRTRKRGQCRVGQAVEFWGMGDRECQIKPYMRLYWQGVFGSIFSFFETRISVVRELVVKVIGLVL